MKLEFLNDKPHIQKGVKRIIVYIVARAIQYMLVTGCRVILCVEADRNLQLCFYSAFRQKKKKKKKIQNFGLA